MTGIINEHRPKGCAWRYTCRSRHTFIHHSAPRLWAKNDAFALPEEAYVRNSSDGHIGPQQPLRHFSDLKGQKRQVRLRQIVSSTPEKPIPCIDHIMHFMTTLTNILVVFAVALLSFVGAAPLAVRDVYVPPVTYPSDGTIWKIGASHNVTWYVSRLRAESGSLLDPLDNRDNSNPPQEITNPDGVIYLRKGDRTTDSA